MKLEPSILNLCTIWNTKGDSVSLDGEVLTTACYSYNFKKFKGHQEYNIWMYKDFSGYIIKTRNNTLLTLGQLIEHVQWIKDFLPDGIVGDFSITEELKSPENPYELCKFKLNIHITGANIYHKLVLTWIRMAYELPYSLIILDANRLDTIEEFNDLNKLNKFLICSTAYPETSKFYWREDMSFSHYTKILPDKILLDLLEMESAPNNPYQYLYNVIRPERVDLYEDIKVLEESESLLDTDTWISDSEFKKRLEIYKNNFKFFKYEQ